MFTNIRDVIYQLAVQYYNLTITPSCVQILVILLFDQKCRNISHSRVPKRRAEVSPFSPKSQSMGNGKKTWGARPPGLELR
jgi:hypothetical protein